MGLNHLIILFTIAAKKLTYFCQLFKWKNNSFYWQLANNLRLKLHLRKICYIFKVVIFDKRGTS